MPGALPGVGRAGPGRDRRRPQGARRGPGPRRRPEGPPRRACARTPRSSRRLVEEAQIGGQLQHPGILPVYELGLDRSRRPFFAMKLVRGRTLADLLAGDGSRPTRTTSAFLGIFEQLCHAMAYAHARGVIHRDLKPSNVMVGRFGEVQVVDWGLAKVLSRGGSGDETQDLRAPDESAAIPRSARAGRLALGGRLGPRHARLHAARAGPRRDRAPRRTQRRLRARGDPLRDPDRAAALRGHAPRDPRPGASRPDRGRLRAARRVRRRRGADRPGATMPRPRARRPPSRRRRGRAGRAGPSRGRGRPRPGRRARGRAGQGSRRRRAPGAPARSSRSAGRHPASPSATRAVGSICRSEHQKL